MIKFFRDTLDGPLYVVITILSIIFIMAIIGFLMERKKLEKEEKKKIAVVNIQNINKEQNVTPIADVPVQEVEHLEMNPISDLASAKDEVFMVLKYF